MNQPNRLPSTVYNIVSLLGAALALFGAAAMIILAVLDTFGSESNPYLGIFVFIVFPGILVIGLLLIPIGMWFEKRRRERGKTEPIVIDLGKRTHRNALIIFSAGTSVFLLLTTIGMYGGYEYTESVEFCGEVCHQVMEPEFVAYHNGAHAKVACARCHIGPGAGWYVKSKLSGARQVFKTIQGSYPRPVPTPVHNLRPAREVCEQCHWPGKFFASKEETWNYYLGDEENSHWQVRALMHIGGLGPHGEHSGSHWHVSEGNRIVYVAEDDSRESFEQITLYEDGVPVVYSKNGEALPDSVMARKEEEGLVREMDCIDCHNRPAHAYQSPMHAVNQALTAGQLDPTLPQIKRKAVEVLSTEYFTSEGARDSIRTEMTTFYADLGVEIPEGTIESILGIYENNFFPHMRVRWERFPDHIGHMLFNGCFRCHGSELERADGHTIAADCNTCHTIISQGRAPLQTLNVSLDGLEFQHPVDIDGAEREMPCTDCHAGDDGIFLSLTEYPVAEEVTEEAPEGDTGDALILAPESGQPVDTGPSDPIQAGVAATRKPAGGDEDE